ncbi:hypothetical protein BsWGS_14567 [Bradybaena similaris]
MNQLRSWLYGHHVPVQDKQPRVVGSSSDVSSAADLELERQVQDSRGQMDTTEAGQPGSHQSVIRSALLKVIPLAPGDCLECKLVGTGVMMLSGVMVLTSAVSARKRNPKLAGLNGKVYLLLCSSLCVGLQAAAYSRLFDVGPFDKHAGTALTTRRQP